MVDSFRNLLQPSHSLPTPTPENSRPLALHSYFDERPALDSPSKKITDHKTQRPWSDVASVSGEPRHHRFANWFGRGHRRGIASRSTESLASPNIDDVTTPSRALSRAKSLHHIRRVSVAPSIAPSVATTRSFGGFKPMFWRRPSATETLASPNVVDPFVPGSPLETPMPTALSRTSSHGSLGGVSPVSSPHRHSTAETTPASSHRKGPGLPWSTTVEVPKLDRAPAPRRRSLFDTPSTPSLIPRTLTRASQALRNPSGSSRFKSFLHSIPLPFLHHTNSRNPTAEDLSPIPTPKPKPQRIGPRRGAIEVLAYDSVVDLARMGAVSDHRPVFAVLAIGIGSEYE
ncbi:hypothetical protein RQP46_004769 [Phenoliferia psychrophenolica]